MFADQPGLLAGHMLATHVANTLRRPISDPTRTAAKRADRRPFVPRRQLTVRQDAPASMASAAIDLLSGMCRRRGRPRPAMGKIKATSPRYTF